MFRAGVKISVIVPAYNEEQLLGRTLAAIRRAMAVFDAAGWPGELIVCDNNSTDATARIALEADARVVFEPVNRIGRARNAGAWAARGEWLVFVDADSLPSPALFEELRRTITEGRCVAGGSTVAFDQAPRSAHLALGAWNAVSRLGKWAAGSFIFCEARAFREVGGFSETLYAAEELDLFRRLKKLARRERRKVVILHRHPLLTSARKARLYSWREHLVFLLKTVMTGGRTLRNRNDCRTWYDGRR